MIPTSSENPTAAMIKVGNPTIEAASTHHSPHCGTDEAKTTKAVSTPASTSDVTSLIRV